jgi:hypothetical protein
MSLIYLFFGYKLLLENVFYLHTGWYAEPASEMIDGRKLNIEQLNEILNGFKKNIQKYYKNQIKKNTPI